MFIYTCIYIHIYIYIFINIQQWFLATVANPWTYPRRPTNILTDNPNMFSDHDSFLCDPLGQHRTVGAQ